QQGAAGGASIKAAFRVLRACALGLRQAGRESGAVLATVSRLDGSFGLGTLGAGTDAISGGLAGLAQTAGHEWPGVARKASDLTPTAADPERASALVIDELFRRGPAEVGLTADGRRTSTRLDAVPVSAPAGSPPLAPGDVVVITGGARGITAEAAVALA